MSDNPLATEHTNKFLVVDDARSMRSYVKAILGAFNAEITEAENGEEALKLIASQQFDLIFLDVNMPGISGLEVCQRVRKELGFVTVPIFIMTAMESREVVEQAFAAGATDYINKTYSQHELIVRTRAILDRRNSERELYLAKKEAELANRSKSDFIINMSHELRTPLNAIIGFSELLENDEQSPLLPGQREQLRHVTAAGWHLLDLINDILDLAKIESGKIAIKLDSVNAGALIEECVQLNQAHASKLGIGIELKLPPGMQWYLRADRTRLKQVLLNLLSNAIKYNKNGGQVFLAVETQPDKKIRLRVSDSGPGIPPEKIQLLFQPFSRLGAEKGSIEGHGVGLALTKRLVELMGGNIGVESVVGQGSSFWVEFPTMAPDNIKAASGKDDDVNVLDARLAALPARKIVYIEDNFVNQLLVSKILEKFVHIELRCADSGEDGLIMIEEDKPDLLLLDMQLPGISGLEVLAQLKGKDGMPVISFSADAMPDDVQAAKEGGAIAYLTKPLNAVIFKRTLLDVLSV